MGKSLLLKKSLTRFYPLLQGNTVAGTRQLLCKLHLNSKILTLCPQFILLMSMQLEQYTKEKLWQMLLETVHASVMYPTHKAYTRDVLLKEKPDIKPEELASRLNVPLSEALVILEELTTEKLSRN